MRRLMFVIVLAAIAVPLLPVPPACAQSREERDIRALVDRTIQSVSTVDPAVARKIMTEYGSDAGPFFPPFAASLNSVADVESDLVQTLGRLSARTLTPTGPVKIKVERNMGWATFPWKADVTFKDGTRRSFDGRATMTVVREGRNWKIAHWHLSLPAPPPLTGSALQAEGEAVVKIERDAWEAAKSKNLEAFNEYWADDASVFSEGQAYRLTGKADVMRDMEAWFKQVDLQSYQMLDPQVQVLGETALLTYYFTETGLRDGRSFSTAGKISMVFTKQDGKWRALHEHISTNRPARQ